MQYTIALIVICDIHSWLESTSNDINKYSHSSWTGVIVGLIFITAHPSLALSRTGINEVRWKWESMRNDNQSLRRVNNTDNTHPNFSQEKIQKNNFVTCSITTAKQTKKRTVETKEGYNIMSIELLETLNTIYHN